LEGDRKAAWAIGPLGHGLHALALYDERVFIAAENGDGKLARRPSAERPKLKVPVNESHPPSEKTDDAAAATGEPDDK
jgi:hypothetical protein